MERTGRKGQKKRNLKKLEETMEKREQTGRNRKTQEETVRNGQKQEDI